MIKIRIMISGSDLQLFRLVKTNDKQAFNQIYTIKYHWLYNVAMKQLKDSSMAEDVVQEVFMKLWEMRCTIEIKENLDNYLYTVMKNMILRAIYKQNKERVEAWEFQDLDNLQQGSEQDYRQSQLYAAIDSLPYFKSKVCKMKVIHNMTNREIAQSLGLSEHTVRSHYTSSIRLLRNSMGVTPSYSEERLKA